MKNNGENIAVIDIGSNSVRLFVFAIAGAAAHQVFARKFFCGLGRDLATTGCLNKSAADMALFQLGEFRKELKAYDIAAELVIGTASLREASDARQFIDAAKEKTGFDIRVIDGQEEARLAALAVISSDPNGDGVVADFGGGSLEMARIKDGGITDMVSLRLGAHYLKALPDRDLGINTRLSTVRDVPALYRPPVLYVIGGSWRSLAKAWMIDNRRHDDVTKIRINPAEFLPFCRAMRNKEPGELVARYQMEAPRAQLMDVSAHMLESLIRELEPDKIAVSTAGIRDGLAYDYVHQQGSRG